MEEDFSVNRRVSRLRRRTGMSRDRLAAMTGIPYGQLCRALAGKRPFYADELPALARVLRVSVDELLEL